ncbi:MAG: hypothetical protein UT58_C0017G0013 [Microgenomates group bacterium GW2011_GWC1_39_7b]|uniref:Uncharacterized protein n=3 Tax=Candidatus Woeseibacteriota TaxID=1752722 RepID=A0A0G0X7B3_9BACT|nr:MAG: hypothetical protein UT17_C0002G0104 [Candidatus Woesebacteria bacterium GW2011_GWB1_39_10]KKR26259.1 MAG: hypothetical protein UT58_C0017G0013 [Microgenomates group bacterium GW2011_GWC1_39_7b]KKR74058.1 MAG: hypothetical protein UU16_C0006G0012 [Candidatus Woesebacteria bacterium GW2011_GWA2_40_7]KKR92545.1 MAG: hypothetical protein UU42_C0001G0149 [Candidatus Woesebacteria bacterium GW2011_GWA1_41_13b]
MEGELKPFGLYSEEVFYRKNKKRVFINIKS